MSDRNVHAKKREDQRLAMCAKLLGVEPSSELKKSREYEAFKAFIEGRDVVLNRSVATRMGLV